MLAAPAATRLGPMFNESSCVGCHNQGGIGGGGAESKNVEILSVIALAAAQPAVLSGG